MKLSKFLIVFISISILLVSFKSDCTNLHWGTKTLYKALQSDYSKVPEGYEPVFINYVGRHGARHLASITADSIMFIVLQTAEKEHGLTNDGMKLKQMDSLLLLVEKGNVSFISGIGKDEQKGLGSRMAERFAVIFADKNAAIKVSTTKKERTKQSAKSFLKGLHPDSTRTITANYNDNDELAFYDVAPAYKSFKENGNWKAAFALIQNTDKAKKLYEELPKKFFTQTFISKLQNHTYTFQTKNNDDGYDCKSFVNGFYDACSIVPSLQKEIEKANYTMNDLDFSSLVTCSDIEEMEYLNSADDFLLKSSGVDGNGIQVRIAAPLLLSFVQSTDDYIATKKVVADLRFAHAETIAPFAAILGITSASEAISQEHILDYNKSWKCETIIPLSANIQWILYKNNTTNDYLVKFLLNEKEVTINGLKDSGTPYYYKWNDVKDFYLYKLEKIGVHIGDDMHNYLMNVK